MTITPAQTQIANAATKTITATGGPGNSLIACICSWGSGTPSISSVKIGTTSLILATSALDSGSQKACYIYYLGNIPVGQTAFAITGANLGLTTSDGGVVIYEFPSLKAVSDNLDHISSDHNTSGNWSSGALGAASQHHQIVVGCAETGVTINSPSGFTNTKPTGNLAIAGYKEITDGSLQTYNASSSTQWAAAVASFNVAGANPGAFMPFIARR